MRQAQSWATGQNSEQNRLLHLQRAYSVMWAVERPMIKYVAVDMETSFLENNKSENGNGSARVKDEDAEAIRNPGAQAQT